MTAQSSVLPGEDAAEFEARRRRLHEDLAAKNGLEAIALDQVAQSDWLALCADRAAAEWSAHRLRHEPIEQEQAEREQAVALGQCLLDELDKPQPFRVGAGPGEPAHPARLVLNLEKSIPGCDWLLGACATSKAASAPPACGRSKTATSWSACWATIWAR